MPPRDGQTRGFKRTSSLLQTQIRKTSESRGFAQSRLLTHWAEVVGADIAAISRPVEVAYAAKGMGATLTLLTTGANAPLLEMQKPQIRDKVNAVYGYNAIARVRVTQTAATGFAEGRVAFEHKALKVPCDEPEHLPEVCALSDGVQDGGLKSALDRLACNVYAKAQQRT